ncbi:hypothetical protein BgiBS90_019697 [Biomphalaria glabrata]|nr:hypothetical protein BgiBS90_019697 [Biomphalaria glabrata]
MSRTGRKGSDHTTVTIRLWSQSVLLSDNLLTREDTVSSGFESGGQHPSGAMPERSPLSQSTTMASRTDGRVVPPTKTGHTPGCEPGGQHHPGAAFGPSPLSQSATMASRTNGGVVPPTKTRKVTVPGGKARGHGTPPLTKTRKVNAPGGKARESGALPPGYKRSKQLHLNRQFSLKRIEVSTISEQYEADVLLWQETLRSDEGPPLLYGFTAYRYSCSRCQVLVSFVRNTLTARIVESSDPAGPGGTDTLTRCTNIISDSHA